MFIRSSFAVATSREGHRLPRSGRADRPCCLAPTNKSLVNEQTLGRDQSD